MADKRRKYIIRWLITVCICIFCIQKVQAANGMTDAAAGILEVQSGFLDSKGQFRMMKSGSGFLIANKDNGTYVITNCSNVTNTTRQIKKYCKKHSIDMEYTQLANHIQIVVKGDVAAQAQIVVESTEKDYCVLSAEGVVSRKESLRLGDSTGVQENDPVYAYGFPEAASAENIVTDTMEYSELDVQSVQGKVVKKEAYLDSGVYLAYAASLPKGYEGGPLLDRDGYVIGLNSRQLPEQNTGVSYALPISEICSVLDNFNIYYGSRAIDEAETKLQELYEECIQLQGSGKYQRDSLQTLEQALDETEKIMAQEESDAASLLEAAEKLEKAKEGLVLKQEKRIVVIWVLFGVDVLLFLWLMILVVKNAQEKRAMQVTAVSKQTPAQEAASCRQQKSDLAKCRLKLVRVKTGQTASIDKTRFIVGKSMSQADFSIADNATVSRKHAVLFEDKGGWYIDDLNSLNGTFLNGNKILPGHAQRLRDGDQITLSGEQLLIRIQTASCLNPAR